MSAEPDSEVATAEPESREPSEWEIQAEVMAEIIGQHRKDLADPDFVARWKVKDTIHRISYVHSKKSYDNIICLLENLNFIICSLEKSF